MGKQKQTEEDKRRLRTMARQKRDAVSRQEAARRSDGICKILNRQRFFQDAGSIFFYYPLGSEANLLPLAKEALGAGKQAAFPRTEGPVMDFYQVPDLEGFKEGAFHVMEPSGGPRMDAERPLALVPGLLFDVRGNRMGYGKGYYDRYFAGHPGCMKVGVCYREQVIEDVPCGEYDIAMDAVVTEEGVIFCGAKGKAWQDRGASAMLWLNG